MHWIRNLHTTTYKIMHTNQYLFKSAEKSIPEMITYKTQEDEPEKLDALLHPLVRKWFFSRFPSYSLPQRFGVSEIHSRKNILITAPTGSTKTLTGFLSVLNELIDSSEKGIL